MSNKNSPQSVNQKITGDGNILVTGDNNTVRQEVNISIPLETDQKDLDQNASQDSVSSPPSATSQTVTGNENIQIIGNNNFIQKIINFLRFDIEQQRAMRHRRIMLDTVRTDWIKGVLEKSLHKEVLIQLGLEERPSAVIGRTWDMQIQMPNQVNRTLPQGTSMLEVFDEMKNAMLILGEPGSGKTTMLLELARDSIDRAKRDNNWQIPVYFNLSSWDGHQVLEDWLINELITKYTVSKKLAENWVKNDDLHLLLDGLDEVRLENREACVKTINDYRRKHGMSVPIAVCSRIADYEALKSKLSLSGAVLLEPLTPEQIDAYFEQAGSELSGAYQALKNDEKLQEMAKQPLILSIMTLAYQGRPANILAIDHSDTIAIRRKQLFDTYIQTMFERIARTKNNLYSPKQTQQWLAWLAHQMIESNQMTFLIERMSPSWLNQEKQKTRYRTIIMLLCFFMIALYGGLGGFLMDTLGVGSGLGGGRGSFGSIFGLVFVVFGFFFLGFFIWIASYNEDINTVDRINWSWRGAIRGAVFFMLIGMCNLIGSSVSSGLVNGISKLIGSHEIVGKNFILSNGLGGILSGLIIGGLIVGPSAQELRQITKPGQRLLISARNSLISFLIAGFVGGFLGMIIGGLNVNINNEVTTSTIDAIGSQNYIIQGSFTIAGIMGLIAGLIYGGFAAIQHYSLRIILSINKLFPWKLIPFLEYCTDRIFLRKVGGGYIFVHRLLMEHFADMHLVSDK